MQGVSMNHDYIFFWNLGNAWKLDLRSKKVSKLTLYVSEDETQTFIKRLRTTSDRNIICIRVQQSSS
jgi:hypothetical protein